MTPAQIAHLRTLAEKAKDPKRTHALDRWDLTPDESEYFRAAKPEVMVALLDSLSAASRVVEAARAIYENDDVFIKITPGHYDRDNAMGDALAAFDEANRTTGEMA